MNKFSEVIETEIVNRYLAGESTVTLGKAYAHGMRNEITANEQ